MNKVLKRIMDSCSVCSSTNIDKILDLPNFPQIGIYMDLSADEDCAPCEDNGLMYCNFCGHVQMEYALDPSFLYSTSFQHKTSQSASAMQANNFLFEIIKQHYPDLSGKTVAEVGCNDTFFLQKFVEEYGCHVVGVDPTLRGSEEKFLQDLPTNIGLNFSVIGEFIEDVDFQAALGSSPDILVSNFVFEHLSDPRKVVCSMLESVADEGICVIGVPTLEFMCFNARFDQMSHQHYQQFSVRSLHQLVEELGGQIISHETNFTNWGQTIVIFRRGESESRHEQFHRFSKEEILTSFELFKRDIETMRAKINHLARGRQVVGFGAAQNFPIFHYFANGSMPFSVVFDDHPQRQNKKFPQVSGIITKKPEEDQSGKVGVLTGPDYARVLFKRMGDLKFDHIISPFSSY